MSQLWYLLPFTKKSQPLDESHKKVPVQLPVEQQRILYRLINYSESLPTTDTIHAFFKSQLDNATSSDVVNYRWFDQAVLLLPTTFCNGLVKFTMRDNSTP